MGPLRHGLIAGHHLTAASCLVLFLVSFPGTGMGQAPDPVLVTATPLPTSLDRLGRSVEIVERTDAERSPVSSVPDLLHQLTFVSARVRGDGLVQSDLSLRGSTFQQVLVTLDGVPLSDPQTAHHNMDLPFPLAALERIVVLPGPATAAFGPTALGGVVDLDPRRPLRSGGRASAAFGSDNTRRATLSIDIVDENGAATAAGSYADSDGFQDGTDYEVWTAWGSLYRDFSRGDVRLSVGHADKEFGARDFYAAFPSREYTSVSLVDIAPRLELGGGWWGRAVLRYRRHEDEFVLIESDPAFFRNDHAAETVTERVVLSSPPHVLGTTAIGVERSDAVLDSSNLGDRDANTSSLFVQHRVGDKERSADIGLRADRHSRWDTEISPSVSASLQATDLVRLRVAVARAVRPPSFTELYYRDPSNEGNPDLDPEEAWGGELGIDVACAPDVRASAAYFVRETRDIIDWVRPSPEEPWRATNIGEATFQGAEFKAAVGTPLGEVRSGFRYTDVASEATGLESKHALNVARHDVYVRLTSREAAGFSLSAAGRYRDVPTLDRYWLVSARAAQRIGRATVFVNGRNLLDEDYMEIPGVPTAGSYVEGGVEWAW